MIIFTKPVKHPGFIMQRTLLLLAMSCFLAACNPGKNQDPHADGSYPTVSYLDIKLDNNGHLPANPYILEFKNGKKQIVFCGVEHLTDDSDIRNPLFTTIENEFFEVRPNIAINEGGDVSKTVYTSKQEAITRNGEIGLTKILCDSLKIHTVNGDPAVAAEFSELLKRYSKGEFLAYIVTERLMWGLKGQGITDQEEIARQYNDFVQQYIIKQGGVALGKGEQSFDFYRSQYERLLKRPFSLEELEPTNPFKPKEKFQEIGRASKEIRDQFLLKTIDRLLDSNNKVFVVFGGWHLLACRPGLEEIIHRPRE